MSALSINTELPTVSVSDEATIAARARKRARQRKLAIWGARVFLAIVIIGGWQVLTDAKIVDKFFWGQPSGIVTQLRDWILKRQDEASKVYNVDSTPSFIFNGPAEKNHREAGEQSYDAFAKMVAAAAG